MPRSDELSTVRLRYGVVLTVVPFHTFTLPFCWAMTMRPSGVNDISVGAKIWLLAMIVAWNPDGVVVAIAFGASTATKAVSSRRRLTHAPGIRFMTWSPIRCQRVEVRTFTNVRFPTGELLSIAAAVTSSDVDRPCHSACDSRSEGIGRVADRLLDVRAAD